MPAQQRLPDQVGPSMPSMSESLHVQRIDLNIFDLGYIQSNSRGLNRKIRLRILEQILKIKKSSIKNSTFDVHKMVGMKSSTYLVSSSKVSWRLQTRINFRLLPLHSV